MSAMASFSTLISIIPASLCNLDLFVINSDADWCADCLYFIESISFLIQGNLWAKTLSILARHASRLSVSSNWSLIARLSATTAIM